MLTKKSLAYVLRIHCYVVSLDFLPPAEQAITMAFVNQSYEHITSLLVRVGNWSPSEILSQSRALTEIFLKAQRLFRRYLRACEALGHHLLLHGLTREELEFIGFNLDLNNNNYALCYMMNFT